MKSSILRFAAPVAAAMLMSGCFTAISGPDGGVIAAGAGPRRAGVIVDPPGPAAVAVGTGAPRRYRQPVYVEPAPVVVRPAPTVVVIPRSAPRVIYRGQSAYFWNGNYYRRTRGGYVVIR